MDIAIEESVKGVHKNHGGPFGAVIVHKGKIIAKNHNRVVKTKDPTAHAEMLVIREAAKKLKRFHLADCELYTTCEPCPMCLSAIYWARIEKVYYGAGKEDADAIGLIDKEIYKILKGNRSSRTIQLIQKSKKKCVDVMQTWVKKLDKVMY